MRQNTLKNNQRQTGRQSTRQTSKHRVLWITDPWDTLDHAWDTTLRLTQEASLLGLNQWWCDVKSIRLEDGKALLDATKILDVVEESPAVHTGSLQLTADNKSTLTQNSFKLGPTQTYSVQDFTSIHYRTDPPVDHTYLHPLQIILLGIDSKKTKVINPISVLSLLNEKMEAAALPGLMPPHLVSCEWSRLLAFGKKEGKTVLKPLHDAQSRGIHLLNWTPRKNLKLIEAQVREATKDFTTPILLQRYFEEIRDGETRLWFLDGKLLATAKKFPIQGDFKVDIDRGSQLGSSVLTRKQISISKQIGKHLRTRKIRLAAVDLIADFITDFNFTSPGLIPRMEKTLQVNLARKIVEKLYG